MFPSLFSYNGGKLILSIYLFYIRNALNGRSLLQLLTPFSISNLSAAFFACYSDYVIALSFARSSILRFCMRFLLAYSYLLIQII